jgi:hypothetical protein
MAALLQPMRLFFKEEAATALKWQRAWQFVIDYLDGNPEISRFPPPISQEIAPYVDAALSQLVFGASEAVGEDI